ncbi:MAG TPA: hypothetical protein VMQ65_04515 [Candidatus Limnocylindria bacterium]|nr:hypothetical protein [Candidatus Limnocylindria bacterium]
MVRLVARVLLGIGAAAFLVIGVPAFLAPSWAVGEFPWAVGPLLAQTIGGWSLGTAAIAIHAVVGGPSRRLYGLLIYLGLFGVGQLAVVAAFAGRLQVGHLLTWPYLVGLAALAVGAACAALSLRGADAATVDMGRRAPLWIRAIAGLVGGFVLFLAVGTLLAGPDGATARGEVLPEPMGLFSIKAFSAFLFALAAAILSLVLSRQVGPYRSLGTSGLYLIVPITLAAALNFSLFDASKPGTLVYFWAYVVVGLVILAVLAYERRRTDAREPR